MRRLFGVEGGYFYLGSDGGKTWLQPQSGLEGGCPCISALAISPNYARDQTMLVALIGNGIFRTTDGGRLWQPVKHQGSGVRRLWKSSFRPAFARDQTAFSQVPLRGRRRWSVPFHGRRRYLACS